MAQKNGKNPKDTDRDQKKTPDNHGKKDLNISDYFLDQLKGAFDNFVKIPEKDRTQYHGKYGNDQYLEQFWAYFKETYPNLLDKIDKNDLPIYIQALEKKGFYVKDITNEKKAGKLHEEFKNTDTEEHIMENSLEKLKNFCDDAINNVPQAVFGKFATVVGFNPDTFEISHGGKLQNIDDLYPLWNKFLERENIKFEEIEKENIEKEKNNIEKTHNEYENIQLGKTAEADIVKMLIPEYNPTERIIVEIALRKIRVKLSGGLRDRFNQIFSLPITFFSPYQDLTVFAREFSLFCTDNASDIDEKLAQEIDTIDVSNGDIKNHLIQLGKKFDDTKGYSEWEQYFRKIFNKLVTRQLFEEVEKTGKNITHYLEAISTTFKEIPPYVNAIFTTYPFNTKDISVVDTSFIADLEYIELQIIDLGNIYTTALDTEKNELLLKINVLKEEREQRRWQGYIAFLRTKEPALADIFTQLVGSKFNFSVLSGDHQQLLIDILIKQKIQDTIKNKVSELLSVDEGKFTQFMDDLFDLKKMDITIETSQGIIPISFIKKEFLASARKQLPSIENLKSLEHLPLNFVTQLTETSAAFFEDSPIFDSIYTDFKAKDGKTVRINDAYLVRITKDGKTVEGYLSAYSPMNERNTEDFDGKELYLYSKPISAPNQERELVTRKTSEGKATNVPVVIKDDEQKDCEIDILDKKINLNGEALGALFFGYVLGQQDKKQKISPQQEKALGDKLGKLKVYQEKEAGEEEPDTTIESTEEDKLVAERNTIKGISAPFVEGTRLFIKLDDSEVPPMGLGSEWIQLKITEINRGKGTFTVKIFGGELALGKEEGAKKEFPLTVQSLQSIKKSFGEDNIYKVPAMKGDSFEKQFKALDGTPLMDKLKNYFGSLKLTDSGFTYSLGEYTGKDITHFGIYEPRAIGETLDNASGLLFLYKIKHNANGTITVSGDSMAGNAATNFPARDMDYPSFMLFIKEKGLQPKCSEQLKSIHAKSAKDKEVPTTKRGFSIGNLMSFFKNSVSTITSSIKKYDDERAEEFTDLMTNQGKLWSTIGGFFSPFDRISSSFEDMGRESFLARDGRIWKKVDTWVKFYSDYDYTKLYNEVIFPMMNGKIQIHPHYKIAAILLVHLQKGKGPYAKNLSTTDGKWVGMLLGNDHQKRYLTIREKKIKELEENAQAYGGGWADQLKNELVELEMRYIVHVMDGRHMGVQDQDKTKYYFQDKYSQKFCSELQTAYEGFYSQSTVDEGFKKNESSSFEFARVEYFRQLADRPQQALPFLKVMATKAINDTQWAVFDAAVMTGLLSGVFLNMTYSTTQSFIQKICRTRGFTPGLFAKDLHQQTKMQRLLDLYSNGEFSSFTKYNAADYSFRNNKGPGGFISTLFDPKPAGKGWFDKPGRMKQLSAFLSLTGKNENDNKEDGKTLLDLLADPTTSHTNKLLLEEYIEKTKDSHESLDPQVQENTSSLTGSILTKSQSVVAEMIKIDNQGFKGKDGDAIQNMQEFSKGMEKAIPKGTETSPEKVKFFVDKFFNRFGERYSGTKKKDLLKRLIWCSYPENKLKYPKEVDDIMYYSIVGEIISSLGRESVPPDELLGALGAWKNFFQNNLATILSPAVSSVFGTSQADIQKIKPILKPWEDCVNLLDPDLKHTLFMGLSQDQKKALSTEQAKLKKENYLNISLYTLATQLAKGSDIENRFKNLATPSSSSKRTTQVFTGAAIKNNPEVMENLRRVLENKPTVEDDEDEDVPSYDYDYPN